VGVVLAVASAVAYGASDFLGGLLTRRLSPWLVAACAQLVGFAALLVVAATVGGSPTSGALWWGALSGVGSGAGTFFLYRGLGNGLMNVVAPLSGVGAALLPVVVGVFAGERPSSLAWLGICCALPAIWLVSSGGSAVATEAGASGAGVRDGLLAGVGFGLLFVALGQVPAAAGLWPLAVGQGVAATVLVGGAVAVRAPWRTASRAPLRGAALVGLTAVAATTLYQLATRVHLVSVAAVLTSLYPALTVLLAVVFLRERVSRVQALGLGLAAASVVLVAAG